MVSSPGRLFADRIACRSEPAPTSAVLVTTKVAALSGCEKSSEASVIRANQNQERRYFMDRAIKQANRPLSHFQIEASVALTSPGEALTNCGMPQSDFPLMRLVRQKFPPLAKLDVAQMVRAELEKTANISSGANIAVAV